MLTLRCKSRWGNWRKTQGQNINYTKFGKRHRKENRGLFPASLIFACMLICVFTGLTHAVKQYDYSLILLETVGNILFYVWFLHVCVCFFITFQQKNATMFPEMWSVLVGGRSVKFHSQVAYFCVCISLSAFGVGHGLSVQPWSFDGNYPGGGFLDSPIPSSREPLQKPLHLIFLN